MPVSTQDRISQQPGLGSEMISILVVMLGIAAFAVAVADVSQVVSVVLSLAALLLGGYCVIESHSGK